MTRKQEKPPRKNPRWDTEPQTFTETELKSAIGACHYIAGEIESQISRMKQFGLTSVTIPAGQGGAGYRKGKQALHAWIEAIRAIIKEKAEDPTEETSKAR